MPSESEEEYSSDMSPLGPPKIAYADSVSCPHGGVLVKVFN